MNLDNPDFRYQLSRHDPVPEPDEEVLRVLGLRIMQQIQNDKRPRLRLEETQPARGWQQYDAKFLKDLGIQPIDS